MFDVKLKLVICGLNLENGQKYILSSSQEKAILPEISPAIHAYNEVANLFYHHTNFDAAWANIRIVDCVIDNNTINVYYMCTIPFNAIINGQWIEFSMFTLVDNVLEGFIKYV